MSKPLKPGTLVLASAQRGEELDDSFQKILNKHGVLWVIHEFAHFDKDEKCDVYKCKSLSTGRLEPLWRDEFEVAK
jgi:hypothetical protein